MHIDKIPNRNSRPTYLLRETYREDGKVKKKKIGNLTGLPEEVILYIRLALKGKKLVCLDDVFKIEESLSHGHVEILLALLRRIGLDRLIASKPSRQRNLVVGMIVERLLNPGSKLATVRSWKTSTLAGELGVEGADEDDLYEALDWLVARQERIEKKLARRHLGEGERALYDISSSYYEGRHCPLTAHGHNRDLKKGKEIIVYGVLTDRDGSPVAMQIYPGNTADPSTVPDQVEKLRGRFGLNRITLVGDRGMLTDKQIETLKQHPGIGWISALRSGDIRELMDQGAIQRSLFDQQNLAEISSPDFPGERLVVCFNPLLCDERHRKREELLEATEEKLKAITREVERRTKKPLLKDEIGMKVGKVIGQYKMKKHFEFEIEDDSFEWKRNEESIVSESRLDGFYVVRTCEKQEDLSAEDTVRGYKGLSGVERVFRCMKSDLKIRPIYHRTSDHVKAHFFLSMLAYYLEWHLRKALASLMFADEELESDRETRDPVAPAEPSASAKEKKAVRETEEGFKIQSLKTLLETMGTRCKNQCRFGEFPDTPLVEHLTEPTPFQSRVLDLVKAYPVPGN